MCGGSSPPPAPDPYATAAMQNQINADAIKTAAQYNQVNQSSPFGSSTYSGTAGDATNPLTQTTTLDPALQSILTGQEGISQGLTDAAGNRIQGLSQMGQFDINSIPGSQIDPNTGLATSFASGGPIQNRVYNNAGQVQTQVNPTQGIQGQLNTSGVQQIGNANQFGQQVQDQTQAAYNAQTNLLQPGFQQDQDQLKGQLAAQGIPEGSQAYNDAIANQTRSQGAIQQQAAASAVGQGLQAQGQLYGENIAGNQAQLSQAQAQGNFANSAAGQGFNQNLQSGQFGNSALAQQFAQGITAGQFGNSAQQQQYDENANSANFANNAIQNNFTNAMAGGQYDINNTILGRNQNFNEAAAFLNGSPVSPSNPTFQGTPQYQAAQASPNAIGLAGSNYTAATNAAAQSNGAIFGALGSLGSALITKCWVAREVYGPGNMRWRDFRNWLVFRAPRWLDKLYTKYGERFAVFISDKPRLKSVIRGLMEACLA